MLDKISLMIKNLSSFDRQKMMTLTKEYNRRLLKIESEDDKWFIEKTNQISFPTKALTEM